MAGKNRRGGRCRLMRAVRPEPRPCLLPPKWLVNLKSVVHNRLDRAGQTAALSLLHSLAIELQQSLVSTFSSSEARSSG